MTFHAAASNANIEVLKGLLLVKADEIEHRNENWETPLFCACAAGQLDAVRVLLEAGARVNARAKKRFTPLHVATRYGHVKVVEELVRAGAATDRETIRNMTPLLVAVKYCQKSCAEFLLQQNVPNVDVNAKDMFHRTTLHWAIKTNQRDIFEVLVSKGADVSASDKFKKTPVMQAVKSDRPELLEHLLELGADRTLTDKLFRRPIHIAALKGHCHCLGILLQSGSVSPDSWNSQYQLMTPLMFAASNGQIAAAKFLLDHGADPNRVNTYDQTALFLVATRRQREFFARPHQWHAMALTLIRGNTDVNIVGVGQGSWREDEQPKKNALEVAFYNGYVDVVKILALAGSYVRSLRKLFYVNTQSLPEFAQKNLPLLDWLKWFYRSPRPLKELARITLLRGLSGPFFTRNLETLDLPFGIQSYLSFSDIEVPSAAEELTDTMEDSESNTEEEMEPSVFDSDLYGDSELNDRDEEQESPRPSYQCLP